jgi:L-lactate dehydrogenase complex protein LldG
MNADARVRQFSTFAEAEAATVGRVDDLHEVPAAVCDYLSLHHLEQRIVTASGGIAVDVPWHLAASLEVVRGPLAADGDTSVTGCYGGIAEAGALVLMSGADQPAELAFLSRTHIVLLRAEDILDDFEKLWSRLREDYGDGILPRTMSFIVGPSRTADLGVPSKLGAHGPARVHILIIGADH